MSVPKLHPCLLLAGALGRQPASWSHTSEVLRLEQAVVVALHENRQVNNAVLETEKFADRFAVRPTNQLPEFERCVLASKAHKHVTSKRPNHFAGEGQIQHATVDCTVAAGFAARIPGARLDMRQLEAGKVSNVPMQILIAGKDIALPRAQAEAVKPSFVLKFKLVQWKTMENGDAHSISNDHLSQSRTLKPVTLDAP